MSLCTEPGLALWRQGYDALRVRFGDERGCISSPSDDKQSEGEDEDDRESDRHVVLGIGLQFFPPCAHPPTLASRRALARAYVPAEPD